jgi:glycine/D-amino acid oxidase-like deaminating enzyme
LLATRSNVAEISVEELRRLVPAVRPGYAAGAALETENYDIDVDVLLQGYLRGARSRGAAVAFRRRSQRISREGGVWRVETSDGTVLRAPVLVNAAGAWGDEVAAQAGIRPLGLVPKRRTAVVIDPAPHAVAEWPRLYDARRSWYCKPEARTRLMVSPADATPTHAHDVQPEELDIAQAVARMQEVLDIDVRRGSWARSIRGDSARKQARSFLKKRTKKLLSAGVRAGQSCARAGGESLFCFFFLQKKEDSCFLPLPACDARGRHASCLGPFQNCAGSCPWPCMSR